MTTTTGEKAGFEPCEDGSYLQAPSPKKARYHSNGSNRVENPVLHVSDVVETVQTEDPGEVDTLTITVPSSQFEIEINSQVEDDDSDDIPQIERSDLTGPAFDIVHDPQELTSLEDCSRLDEGGTLTAIGRALLQMQQGSTQNQLPLSLHSVPSSNNQQVFLSQASSVSDPNASIQNSGAPLYVMIPPASSAEILQAIGQTRPIAPKCTSPTLDLCQQDNIDPKSREAQRKATHNEVERRRRDRINELIKMLAMIVPGCQKKDATTGNIVGYVYSKGTVLDKTVEYLRELIAQNNKLGETAKMAEKSANALALIQNQIAVLEKENAFLRAQIIQFGIDAAASTNNSNSQQQSSAMMSRHILSSPLAQSLLNTVAQSSQPSAPPPLPTPPPPPPPADSNAPAMAQQLLISLAQSLTNSPLLTSLSQNPGALSARPNVTVNPSHLTPASVSAAHLSVVPASTTHMTSLPLVTLTSVTPQPLQVASPMAATVVTSSPPQVSPLISSLIQTLASIANPNTSTSTALAVPKVVPTGAQTPPRTTPTTVGGLSATATANLLNTLIMAQNVLTNNSGGVSSAQGGGISIGNLASLLGGSLVGLERGEP